MLYLAHTERSTGIGKVHDNAVVHDSNVNMADAQWMTIRIIIYCIINTLRNCHAVRHQVTYYVCDSIC